MLDKTNCHDPGNVASININYIQYLNEDTPARKRTKQNKRAAVEEEIEKLNEPKKMYCFYGNDPIENNDTAILGWVRQEMCTPSEKRSFADMVADKTDLDLIHMNNGLIQKNDDTLHDSSWAGILEKD